MATIFFKSNSIFALNPLIKIVNKDRIVSRDNKFCSKKLKRIKMYTPAVTKVEECTREETGVGAAIAAGSQEEKGY